MATVLDTPSHSLKEFRILPGYTPPDGNALNVSLSTSHSSPRDVYTSYTADEKRGE